MRLEGLGQIRDENLASRGKVYKRLAPVMGLDQCYENQRWLVFTHANIDCQVFGTTCDRLKHIIKAYKTGEYQDAARARLDTDNA